MRKWALLGVSVALLGGFAWVAAPALSLRPYEPGGVDFESAIPKAKRVPQPAIAAARAAHPHEQAARWISPPIDAPHRFDLVGVTREEPVYLLLVRIGRVMSTN